MPRKPSKFRVKTPRAEFGVVLERPAKTLKGRAGQARRNVKKGFAVQLSPKRKPGTPMKGANLTNKELKQGFVSVPEPRKRK